MTNFIKQNGWKIANSLIWLIGCIIPTYQLVMNNDPQHHWLRCMNLLLYVGMIAAFWSKDWKHYNVFFNWFMYGYALAVVVLDVLWLVDVI